MKKVILITIGILLLLTVIVLMYFKGDFTADDMNDILARTTTIDICRNMDMDNNKLLDCEDDSNELVMTIARDNENYEALNNVYANAREVNIITDSLRAKLRYKALHFYKVVFKDDKGNVLGGATLGCDQSYIKVEDTIYNLNHAKICGDNYDSFYKYLQEYDKGYEAAYKKFEEKYYKN